MKVERSHLFRDNDRSDGDEDGYCLGVINFFKVLSLVFLDCHIAIADSMLES